MPESTPPSDPKMIEYTAVVRLSLDKEIHIFSTSPEEASERSVAMVRAAYPEPQWRVRAGQVDYHTEHGGESHWYPND